MSTLVNWFHDGGGAMYGVLALFIAASVIQLALGGFGLARWRIPAPLWLGGPLLTVLVGACGAVLSQLRLMEALPWVDAESVPTMTWAGHSFSLIPGVFSLYAGVLLLLGVLWILGLVLVSVPGEQPRWTPVPAALALAIPLLGAPAVAALASVGETGPGGWLPAVFLVAGSLPLGLGCAREGDPAIRLHTGRQVMAAALLLGTVWCALAGYQWSAVRLYDALAFGDPGRILDLELVLREAQRGVMITGGLSALVGLLASSCAMVFSLRRSFDLRSITGAVVVVGMVLAWLGLEAWAALNAAAYLV